MAEAERESPIAGDLLQLLAFLAPEDIPRNLLTMPVEIAFLLFDVTNAIVVLITTIAIVRTQTHAIRLGMWAACCREMYSPVSPLLARVV